MLGLSGWLPEDVNRSGCGHCREYPENTETLLCAVRKPVNFREDDIVFRMGEFFPAIPTPCACRDLRRRPPDPQTISRSAAGGHPGEGPGRRIGPTSPSAIPTLPRDLAGHRPRDRASIAGLFGHEDAWRARTETLAFLDSVCPRHAGLLSSAACRQDGILPGGLNVRRRRQGVA